MRREILTPQEKRNEEDAEIYGHGTEGQRRYRSDVGSPQLREKRNGREHEWRFQHGSRWREGAQEYGRRRGEEVQGPRREVSRERSARKAGRRLLVWRMHFRPSSRNSRTPPHASRTTFRF